jgi:hypothetical protein
MVSHDYKLAIGASQGKRKKKKEKRKKKKVRARHSSLIFKDNTKLRNIIIGKRSCGLGLRYAFRAFIIPKLL